MNYKVSGLSRFLMILLSALIVGFNASNASAEPKYHLSLYLRDPLSNSNVLVAGVDTNGGSTPVYIPGFTVNLKGMWQANGGSSGSLVTTRVQLMSGYLSAHGSLASVATGGGWGADGQVRANVLKNGVWYPQLCWMWIDYFAAFKGLDVLCSDYIGSFDGTGPVVMSRNW